MLGVNVYREDLATDAGRKAIRRRRAVCWDGAAMSQRIVNNLLNHLGVPAIWKCLALARFQVGLAILLLNTPKWYKTRHSQLPPMTMKPAR